MSHLVIFVHVIYNDPVMSYMDKIVCNIVQGSLSVCFVTSSLIETFHASICNVRHSTYIKILVNYL